MSPLPLLAAILVGQAAVDGGPASREPPVWVVEGVPDTVWILVEETFAEEDNDRVKEMLKEAEAHARLAAEGHENDVGRRLALAIVLGRRADTQGGRTKIEAASDCHRELEAVLELAPEQPQARYLMGRIYAGVRRMNWVTRWIATSLLGGGELKKATWEAAEEHLLFAEQVQSEVSDYHLQLGRLYGDTDRPELALQEVQHVLELPATTAWEISVRDRAIEFQLKLLN
jgi:hypothetical protein